MYKINLTLNNEFYKFYQSPILPQKGDYIAINDKGLCYKVTNRLLSTNDLNRIVLIGKLENLVQ